jgi:hypothetical protein
VKAEKREDITGKKKPPGGCPGGFSGFFANLLSRTSVFRQWLENRSKS